MNGPSLPRSVHAWKGLASEHNLRRAGFSMLVLSTIAMAVLSLWISVSGAPDIRGVELNVVYTIVKALGGRPLYTDPTLPPFDVAQYGPLYYLICLGLAWVFGLSAGDTGGVLMVARLVSVASAAAIFALLAFLMRRRAGCEARTTVIAVCFASVAVAPWYVLARPDALMWALGLAAFVAALVAVPEGYGQRPWLAFLAGILSTLACLAKQNGVEIAVVVLVYFLVARRSRNAVAMILGLAVSAAVAIVVCQSLWPHLIANVIRGVDNGVSIHNAFEKTYSGFFSNFSLLLGLSLLAVITWMRKTATPVRMFFVVALPVLFAAAVISGLKVGSAENYFNEFIVLACGALGYYVDSSGSSEPEARSEACRVHRGTLLTVIFVFLLAFLPFFTAVKVRAYWWWIVAPSGSLVVPDGSLWGGASPKSQARREIAAFLRLKLGERPLHYAVCLDGALAVEVPERCAVPEPEVALNLFERKLLDYSVLRRQVQAGLVPYIVTRRPLPTSFLGLDLSRVTRVLRVADYEVFEFPQARN